MAYIGLGAAGNLYLNPALLSGAGFIGNVNFSGVHAGEEEDGGSALHIGARLGYVIDVPILERETEDRSERSLGLTIPLAADFLWGLEKSEDVEADVIHVAAITGLTFHWEGWLAVGAYWPFGWERTDVASGEESAVLLRPPTTGLALSTAGLLPESVDEWFMVSAGAAIYRYGSRTRELPDAKGRGPVFIHEYASARFGYGLKGKVIPIDESNSFWLGAFQDWNTDLRQAVWMAGTSGELLWTKTLPRGGFTGGLLGLGVAGGYLAWPGPLWTLSLVLKTNTLSGGIGGGPSTFMLSGLGAGEGQYVPVYQ